MPCAPAKPVGSLFCFLRSYAAHLAHPQVCCNAAGDNMKPNLLSALHLLRSSSAAFLGCLAPALAWVGGTAGLAQEAPSTASRVLGALANHNIVLIGENPHRGRRIHDFYLELLDHPEFHGAVDDILVEFGNSLFQDTMDQFLLELKAVDRASLAKAWRDTTQPLVWDSPVYENLVLRVRAQNEKLPPKDRVRLLLGDPPIDWSQVHSAEDLSPWLERESSYLTILEREVLSKHRKALVLIGAGHCLKRTENTAFAKEATDKSWLAHHLEERHPGEIHSIYPFFGRSKLADHAEVTSWEAPSLLELVPHGLAEVPFGSIAHRVSVQREVNGQSVWVPLEVEDWPSMETMVDALLYLGEERTDEMVAPPTETYGDQAYLEELLRRARLLDQLFSFDHYVPLVQGLQAEQARAK